MAREKYKTLTEQMFYILICLRNECCGMDVMGMVEEMTKGRIRIGAGTMYTLLSDFQKEGIIKETAVRGRKRSYIVTKKGMQLLNKEYERLIVQINDYEKIFKK
ncbi:PadR family transcriptional regulator [Eubacterium sp.]